MIIISYHYKRKEHILISYSSNYGFSESLDYYFKAGFLYFVYSVVSLCILMVAIYIYVGTVL